MIPGRKYPLQFLNNPYRFGGSGGSGLIDAYTTNLWGAYGLERLRGTFGGSAIRVRRSSDNAEQDIGFTGNALNTTALATFVGSNDGFVTTWYDQSGGANNLVQTTAANQPLIVDAGTYLKELIFDGVNDSFVSANNSGTPAAMTVHVAGRQRTFDANLNRTIMKHASSQAEFSYQNAIYNSYYGSVLTNGGSGVINYNNPAVDDNSTFSFCCDRAGALVQNELTFYPNGSALTGAISGTSVVSGNYTAGVWNVGYNGASNWSRLATRAILIYETAQSAPTVASIAALIKPPLAPVDQLDNFTTNLFGFYSIRHLRTAYAGACLRVRRSSDNAEQDIGFSSGYLDSAALLTFVGANSGFVTKWYDQGSGAKDLAQATAANQPRIVNAGVYDGAVTFDGSNDFLTTPNSGTPTAFSTYIRANTTSSTATQIYLEHNSTNTNNSSADYRSATNQINIGISETSGPKAFIACNTIPTGQVLASVRDRTLTGSTNICKGYSGGLLMASSSTANLAITANFVAAPWYIGSRNGTTAFAGQVTTLAIYETAHNAATVERISRAIG